MELIFTIMLGDIKIAVLNEDNFVSRCHFANELPDGSTNLHPVSSPLDDIALPMCEDVPRLESMEDALPILICTKIYQYIFWDKVKECDFIGAFHFCLGKPLLVRVLAKQMGIQGFLRHHPDGTFMLNKHGKRIEFKTARGDERWNENSLTRIRSTLILLDDIMDNHLTVPRNYGDFQQERITTYAPLLVDGSLGNPSDFFASGRYTEIPTRHQSVADLVFDELSDNYYHLFNRGPLNSDRLLIFGEKCEDGLYYCTRINIGFVIFDKPAHVNGDVRFNYQAFHTEDHYRSPPWVRFAVMARFAFGDTFGVYARVQACDDESIPFSFRLALTAI